MKIRAMGAELFHADGRTDITMLTVAFHSFAKTPKKNRYHALIIILTNDLAVGVVQV
jgi:phosphoserine phosphatase